MKLSRILTLVVVAGATIFALASCGKSTSVTSANVVEQAPLVAPDGVTDVYYPGQVLDVLHWNPSASPRVTGYQVYMSSTNPANGGVPLRIATLSADASMLKLQAVDTDCVQYYQIRCTANGGTYSAFSTPLAVQRHAPNTGSSGGGGGSGPAGGTGKIDG